MTEKKGAQNKENKKLQTLRDRIRGLEQMIGQKQLMIDFQSKVIEMAEEEYQIDIKKKFGVKPFYGSGSTGTHTK
jgi:transposase